MQLRELGIRDARPPSVTGGMAFAGGPLNHFVFQALVRMAGVLRADPGSTGLVTAVSGMLTKQGVSLWSSEPGAAAFAHDDVSEATARETAAVARRRLRKGRATVATYTVFYTAGRRRARCCCAIARRRAHARRVRRPGFARRATERSCAVAR